MNVLHYLAVSFRSWLKTPVVFAVAVMMLAVGIGASVAAYGFLHAAFLQPLAVSKPHEIVRIFSDSRGTMPPGLYYDLVEQSSSLSESFMSRLHHGINFQVEDRAVLVTAGEVSGNYFQVLKASPKLGRTLLVEDDTAGAAPVVVVSESFWRDHLGSRNDLVGASIQLNGRPATLVGVMPRSFKGAFRRVDVDVWFPHQQVFEAWHLRHRDFPRHTVQLRLSEGKKAAQVQAQLDVFAAYLKREVAGTAPGLSFQLAPEAELNRDRHRTQISQSFFILGVLLTLLLIACANVSNIILAKLNARRHEMAVRRSLGARARSIFAILLADGILVGAVAGVAGLLVAFVFFKGFSFVGMDVTPGEVLNLPLLSFFLAVALGAGVLCSMIPAVQAVRVNINELLKESSRTSTRFRSGAALIVVQVALSLVLLTGSGLFIRSLHQAQKVDAGFDAGKILSFGINLGNLGGYDVPARVNFYRRLAEALEENPNISTVGTSTHRLFDGPAGFGSVWVEGMEPPDGSQGWGAAYIVVGPGFYEAMGIPILHGRAPTREDFANVEKIAVINEALANHIWPDEDPIGRRFQPWGRNNSLTLEVVGVCRDFRVEAGKPPSPVFMYPVPVNQAVVKVQTRVNPHAVKDDVLRIMRGLEPGLPIHDLRTAEESLAQSIQPIRAGFGITVTVGFLGLGISIVGIYSALSYWIGRSSREIGLRIALGATSEAIMRLYVGRALLVLLCGIFIGLAVAAYVMPHVQDLLYQVDARDPLTFVAVPAVLFIAALISCYFSARHAARVDPMEALRNE